MLYLGCSQWNYSFWKGNLYPDKAKKKNYLQYYSGKFNSVELNSTFYELPEESIINDWVSEVNPGFKFCPKFPGRISHEKYLRNIEKDTDEFIDTVLKFGKNLGPCFLQLSPSMYTSGLNALEDLLSYINGRIKISVELRQDWLSKNHILKPCLDMFKEFKTGVVMVDGAETIQYLNNLKLTSSTAFVRFLCYNHSTDYERINDWVSLIKYWQDKSLSEVFFMLHFGDRENEPEIINYTIEKFSKN